MLTKLKYLSQSTLFIFLLFFTFEAEAKKDVANGIITDSITGEPIAHVEVFISGTTVGCITDGQGKFSLKLPFLPCALVADHISYKPYIKILQNSPPELKISLTPSVYSISEVEVKSKSNRRSNLRYFYSHFIPENRKKIEILNDSVLFFSRTDMKFTAKSNAPLIIVNRYLGYKITVLLDEFSVIRTNGPTGEQIRLNSNKGGVIKTLSGYYYYELLNDNSPKKMEEYVNNRRNTYYGSYRHLLKSIYEDDCEAQGFLINSFPEEESAGFIRTGNTISSGNVDEFNIDADSIHIYYYSDVNKNPMPVEETSWRRFYNQSYSKIYPTNEPFLLRQNGTSPKLTFVIIGLLFDKSFANSLPEDYVPTDF